MLRLRAALSRITGACLAVFLNPLLNLGMRHRKYPSHCALEALPCFGAFDHFSFALHGFMITFPT